jgi:nucleoside-diphosphate-sugar epimerase
MSRDAHGFFEGKSLVVFGAGYVGAAFAREAASRGARVWALTRNHAKAAALAADGIATVVADLAGSDWHARVPVEVDGVVNCVSSGGGGTAGYRHSYVDGLRSILAWGAGAREPGTLVYTGSTSVYPQDGGVRVDEQAPTEPAEGAAEILLEAEALARTWPGRSFVLRLAGIYGPGRHHLLDALRNGAGALPGAGNYRLNLVHRDDIVAALVCALTAPPEVTGGIFNVADDGAALKAEIAAWLASNLGVGAPTFTGAAAPGRRRITPDRVIANDRLKAVLGWRPRYSTYREGYAELLRTDGD